MRICVGVMLASCVLGFAATNVAAQADADAEQTDATVQADDASATGDHVVSGEQDLGHGNAGPQLENVSEFRSDLAIYTFVVFMLLMAILGKFAWPVINEALVQREQGIADNIAAAAATHEEAKRLLADYEVKLAGTADQVREMLEEARRDGEHTKSQIVAEAKAAAGAEKDRAMRDVRNAKESALKEIGELGANLAVELASKIVQREVSEKEHTQLIRDAVAKFPDAEPSRN